MGNICNGSQKNQNDIRPANLPNHKRKNPIVIAYELEKEKSDSLSTMSEPERRIVKEEGKRNEKNLKPRYSSFS